MKTHQVSKFNVARTRAGQDLLGYLHDGYQVLTNWCDERQEFAIITARHTTNGNRLTIRVCIDSYQVLINNKLRKIEVVA